jgi:hypothetical protein
MVCRTVARSILKANRRGRSRHSWANLVAKEAEEGDSSALDPGHWGMSDKFVDQAPAMK